MSNDRDDRTEAALRRALAAEAAQISPGGDGLMRIQQRAAAREARMRWLRPAMAGGVAVAVIAAGIGGYAIAHHNSGNANLQVSNTPSSTPHVTSGFPAASIFPFTDASQEQQWEVQFAQGSQPWISDPEATATFWVENYLKQGQTIETVTKSVTADSADVTLGRKLAGSEHSVTVVHLVKFHNAWLVTGASDPAGQLAFTSPTAGASVTSPLTVTGPGYGVDEQAIVEIRNATTPDLFGTANTGPFGNGTPQWSATVPFSATSNAGVLVVTVPSPADGGPGVLAAEKVTFGSASHAVAAGSSTFFGVQGGRLIRFNAATGAKEADLNSASNEGTVFEVRQFGDTVYFTAKASDCLSTLYSMPAGGGVPATVATADPGYGIVGFDVSSNGRLVYSESGCGDLAGKGALVFAAFGHGPGGRTISFPSEPPALIGDPVWEPDGIHVDAFVRTGMEGYLARYDSTSGNSPTPTANACSGYDVNGGMPNALAVGPGGVLWFAVQTGTSMQVLSCANNTPTVEFTVNGNDTPQSLSVNAPGNALLVGSSGKVWEWTGTGSANQLANATGVSSVSW